MKRSLSDSPSPSPPTTPPAKAKKTSVNSSPNKTSPSKDAKDGERTWDAAKREALIEELLTIGLKNCKPAEVAAKVGISVQQFKNATQNGANNLRRRVIKAAGPLGK